MDERSVRYTLGGLWILDGLLQLQPLMFTMSMIAAVLVPVQSGEPRWVIDLIGFVINLGTRHLYVFNFSIAAVQIGVGLAVILAGTSLWPYLASFAWSLAIWVAGQAFGSLMGGQTTLWQGAPGSAVLYALVTWAAWPRPDPRRRIWITRSLSAIWALGALLQLQPAFFTTNALSQAILQNTGGQPVWLQWLLNASGGVIAAHPVFWTIALAVFEAAIAIGIWFPRTRRAGLAVSVLGAAAAWVLGQTFGMFFTWMATDPNSAPLLGILAAYCWPRRPARAGDRPVATGGGQCQGAA